jgi:hypothetical protein
VLATVAALYLEMLNPEHRRAVEQGTAAVCTEKLNPDVVAMKSAKDWI